MNAIRQFIDVKNHSFNVVLPNDFTAKRVEVIILPLITDEIPQWQKTESLRRLAIYKNDPTTALDFDEVMDEIETELWNVRKVISADATQNIKENATWYNARQKGLGKQFTTQIRKTINYIADFPLAFPEKYADFRVAVVDIFPYTIHYYYDQQLNTVFVACVFHDTNDPEILTKSLSNL